MAGKPIQATLEQDLQSYEEFCDPNVLTDVIDGSCDLLHKFVGHANRLKRENGELLDSLKGLLRMCVAAQYSVGFRGNQVDRMNHAKALIEKHEVTSSQPQGPVVG